MENSQAINNNITFQHYLVAFLDLVGQRDALRKLLSIPNTPTEKKDFIENIQQSMGRVLVLRQAFKDFFNAATRHDRDLSRYPVEFQKVIREAMHTEYTITGMSDAIVIAVPLGGKDEFCRAMNGVELTIQSICGLAIGAFATGIIFRGGLDIGIATQIEETIEVYGSALVNAYHLETEVAEYPRFVVSDGMMDFIKTIQNQAPQTVLGKLAKHSANVCRKMIIQDTDGRQMLDFLGSEIKATLGGSVSPELFTKGHDYVDNEYKKFKKLAQEKLSSRYFRLLQYYLARKKVWS